MDAAYATRSMWGRPHIDSHIKGCLNKFKSVDDDFDHDRDASTAVGYGRFQ